MNYISRSCQDGVVTLTLARGKVNALNEALIIVLDEEFRDLETDSSVRSVILTGNSKFFCFGFDLPELLPYTKKDFTRHLTRVTDLYAYLFSFPKPVIAALNGHAAAGGCALALTCDRRIMARGPRIGLTEINLGSTLTAGATAMLRYLAGGSNAEKIILSGSLFDADEALGLGLVDEVVPPEGLMEAALRAAMEMGEKDPVAFAATKRRVRKPVIEEMWREQSGSVLEFVEIWYSENTRAQLGKVVIRS